MKPLLLGLACLVCGPSIGHAQELIGSYTAYIGPADRVNSSGVPLTDFGAILQQDRANVHRFGRADQLDYSDPVFGNANFRARIPAIWRVMPGSEYVVERVLTGQEQLLSVLIYGVAGEPLFIMVMEGAG